MCNYCFVRSTAPAAGRGDGLAGNYANAKSVAVKTGSIAFIKIMGNFRTTLAVSRLRIVLVSVALWQSNVADNPHYTGRSYMTQRQS